MNGNIPDRRNLGTITILNNAKKLNCRRQSYIHFLVGSNQNVIKVITEVQQKRGKTEFDSNRQRQAKT